jgi:hypothetical protein
MRTDAMRLTNEPTPAEVFAADGIVRLRGKLDTETQAACRHVFDWSLSHPGNMTKTIYEGTEHEHWADNVNPNVRDKVRALAATPVFADIVCDLLQTRHAWYLADEIFYKTGGKVGRTPWHQDTSYAAYGGPQMCNLWISFESLPRQNSIEVVRGSHLGPQYDGSSYDDPENPAKPLHGGDWTPLPDIERERKAGPDSWDVVSYAYEPGDIIAFHPHCLHGGAPLGPDCPERHTLVLRFFGDEAYYKPLGGERSKIWEGTGDEDVRDDYRGLNPGDPLGNGTFLQIR